MYLIRATQVKNEQLVNNINDGLIDLRNAINRKEIPQNESKQKSKQNSRYCSKNPRQKSTGN